MYRFRLLACVAFTGFVLAAAGVACGGGGTSNATSPTTTGEGGVDGGGLSNDAASPNADASTGNDASSGGGDAGAQDAAEEPAVEAGPFVPAAHPPWPQLSGNGKVVLNPMNLVTIVSTGDPEATDLFAFGDQLVTSAWWSSFSTEYGLGTPVSPTVHITGPAITTNPTETDIVNYIASATASTPAAAANGNTMYMVYLPPNIEIIDPTTGQPNTNCQYYGGFHTPYGKGGDSWGIGQHCPLAGTGLTDLEWMTIVGSHEIAEGASDPQPGNGWELVTEPDTNAPWTQPPWVAALYGEIGDMCVDTQVTEGSYTYQRIWSNAAAANEEDPCVPAYSQYAYVNASAPEGWYKVAAGSSVQIPVTGWSDRATSDWIVDAEVWTSNAPASAPFAVTLTSPTVYPTDAGNYPTTNNGKVSQMTVTVPAGTASGTWADIVIFSEPLVYSGDPFHIWLVGVYVP